MPSPYSATTLLAELPRLRRYARILTDDPEHADRLVEETLDRARQIGGTTPIGHFAPGTGLIALLRAVNAARTMTHTPRAPKASLPGVDQRARAGSRPSAQPAQSPLDRGAEMLARLRELPLEQREILMLVAVELLSYAEIAMLLQMPVATVVSRLSQAREALRASASKSQSTPSTY
jgi:RNA polymerase sigma-70 factor (ECF subfamily)